MISSSNVKQNEPMKKHTSFKVGGNADIFFKPRNLEDLRVFLAEHKNEKIFWLGLGSNLLVRDGGIRGVVIAMSNALTEINLINPSTIEVQAGVSCAKLSRFSNKKQLAGLEFLSGIPGTVGGALAMNAGAFGGEIWSFVTSVTTINRNGELTKRTPSDYKIAYRSVTPMFKQESWFVSAEINLPLKTTDNSKIGQILKKRNENQPIGKASCGSVFKNPKGLHAAQLIENSGLKSYCIGDACVSQKHANFIINQGNSSALDIEKLIFHISYIVKRKYKVQLLPEVQIIGEPL